jgi:hypothetical protein
MRWFFRRGHLKVIDSFSLVMNLVLIGSTPDSEGSLLEDGVTHL